MSSPLKYAFASSQEEMTVRARMYLVVGALRHLVIGLTMWILPHTFDAPSFQALFDIAPRWFWIVTMTLGGLHLSYSALKRHGGHARTALTISAAVSFMWAWAFGIVAIEGTASILATTIFVALGLKDLIMCAQPLRSPFERLGEIYQ